MVDQDIEFRLAVPGVILVVEVNPKPHATLPVVHVDGPAMERVIMGEKDYLGRWELKPTIDLGVVSEFQQPSNSILQCLLLAYSE
jgi:hypothetical protein